MASKTMCLLILEGVGKRLPLLLKEEYGKLPASIEGELTGLQEATRDLIEMSDLPYFAHRELREHRRETDA